MAKKLTLVLPAHNEAGSIERVVASFLDIRDRMAFALTLLIVDDGSSDATGPICRGLSENNPSVRYVHHPRNIMAAIPIKEVPCSHFPRTTGNQSGGTLRVIGRALPEVVHVWRLKHGRGP
jgi:hypothetical protein